MEELPFVSFAPAGEQAPRKMVILLHGLSGNGHDMSELAAGIQRVIPDAVVIAPHGLQPALVEDSPLGRTPPYQRQWFNPNQPPAKIWHELNFCALKLQQFVCQRLAQYQLSVADLAICGYSQGGVVAWHFALRLPETVAGVIGYASLLANPDGLKSEIRAYPRCYLLHGVQDNIVPIEHFHTARLALFSAGLNVQTETFDDVCHLLTPAVANSIGRCVEDCLG